MTGTESQHADIFIQPRRLTGEANRALKAWQNTACSMLQESWRALLGSELTITPSRTDSVRAIRAVGQLADPGYAAKFYLGPDSGCSLFCMSSQMLQSLVNDMLGTPSEEWPEVRDLTAVEVSMAELLFGEVERAISQSWPETTPLECHLHEVVARPMRSRFYPPDDVLVRTNITVSTTLGDVDIVWLIPRETLTSIGITDAQEDEAPAPAPQLRTLAEDIPVELSVRLGETSMKLSELERIQIGDYIRLEQTVADPLQVTIDGTLHWLGHACRMGTRQGFEIIATNKD